MTRQKKSTRVPRPSLLNRIQLALSTGRYVDGVWVGSWRTSADLRRVEDALLLIKQHSRIHYSRVARDLTRVWVIVLPNRSAKYKETLGACLLDERYVAKSTLEQIASTIVHEATHAGLARRGIKYEENLRSRIEAVCIRRELSFAAKLSNSAELQGEITRSLEWCVANTEWFSNERVHERHKQEAADALRYIKTPEWLISIVPKVGSAIWRLRRLLRSTGSRRPG